MARTSKTPKTSTNIVGTVNHAPIDSVCPNNWNPNKMNKFMKDSLKRGLEQDGWLASQSLLVWGTDENGQTKNVIIDGEHRWLVAKQLGFTEAPMMTVGNLTEKQAKALTIKLNQKKGAWDDDLLTQLLQSMDVTQTNSNSHALDLGLEQWKLDQLFDALLPKPSEDPSYEGAKLPSGQSKQVKIVQLFFNDAQHAQFLQCIRVISERFKYENVSQTILEELKKIAEIE